MRSGSGMALHTQMMIGFIIGSVLGTAAFYLGHDAPVGDASVGNVKPWLDALLNYVTGPIGDIFLRLLFMLVIPLVFSALVLGVVEIGDPKSLGRIGGRTLVYILTVTTLAVLIGLVAVNIFKPGDVLDSQTAEQLLNQDAAKTADILAKGEAASAKDVLLNIVPKNPFAAAVEGNLIAVMFFALMFGIAAAVHRSEGVNGFLSATQGVYDISLKLIDWVIRTAPYAVAALMFSLLAARGVIALLPLVNYVLVAFGAMAVHMFIVFPLLIRFLGKMSPLDFFRKAEPAMLTAFSTSSSSATLPTTLQVAEERLGTPRHVGRFVCTLGATANMNGTALFEGVTVLFLAQYFNVELSLVQQLLIVLMCVLGGIGAAGVPGGSLPVIASILVMFGINPAGIGMILGVDRFLDMCRTCVNVTGDLVGTVVISRGEPENLQQSSA